MIYSISNYYTWAETVFWVCWPNMSWLPSYSTWRILKAMRSRNIEHKFAIRVFFAQSFTIYVSSASNSRSNFVRATCFPDGWEAISKGWLWNESHLVWLQGSSFHWFISVPRAHDSIILTTGTISSFSLTTTWPMRFCRVDVSCTKCIYQVLMSIEIALPVTS